MNATCEEIAPETTATFVGLPDLLRMKWLEEADRIVRQLGRAAERRGQPRSKPDGD